MRTQLEQTVTRSDTRAMSCACGFLIVAASVLTAVAGPGVTTPKKGVGLWYWAAVDTGLTNSGVSWCYDWDVSNEAQWCFPPPSIEFVPMIWDETDVLQTNLDRAASEGTILLGFNEPDHADQADMTVGQALTLWPQLESTGMRLGSPAMAGRAYNNGSWLDQFMDGVASNEYRVDFICVHIYIADFNPTNATEEMRSYLQATFDKYRKPIWVTESGLMDWSGPTPGTDAQQAAFWSMAVPMLESLPFVERYAPFALSPGASVVELCNTDGSLTGAGIAYRDAGPGPEPVGVTKCISMDENTSKAITLTATDIDGGPLTFAIITSPTNGTLSGTPPNVTYTPHWNYEGPDRFTFRVNDGTNNSLYDASIEITVLPVTAVTSNNSVPYTWLAAQDASWSNDYESAATNDADGDGLTTAEEYWAGTDPMNSNSLLKIDDMVKIGTDCRLSWAHSNIAGALPPITIQTSTNLLIDSWGDAGSYWPSNGVHSWLDAASQRGAFYRLCVTNIP